jgi:hypothetical protein
MFNNDQDTLLSIYQKMVTVRKFETLTGELFAAGKIPGFIHLSNSVKRIKSLSASSEMVPPIVAHSTRP